MIAHRYRQFLTEHVGLCSYSQALKVPVIISGAEGGIVERQEIVIRCRGKLSENDADRFGTITVIERSYDLLSYVLLSLYGANGDRSWAPGSRGCFIVVTLSIPPCEASHMFCLSTYPALQPAQYTTKR